MTTIYAPLTPLQVSPVIVLRISGADSLSALKFFGLENIKPRSAVKARYKSLYDTDIQDDVIIICYKGPNSYTGEDVLEISFHGNPIIAYTAMKDFNSLGFRLAEPGEFTRRAYLMQKLTLTQAEAVNAVIHSRTSSGIKLSSNSLYGNLDKRFYDIREKLIKELANIEANIDFSEESYEEDDIFNKVSYIFNELKNLTDSYDSARAAVDGVHIGIVGKPNVGKSSIFNLILNKDRAIVSSEAGTTRDTISELTTNDGVQFNIIDTAGIRQTESISESEGVKRSYKVIDESDLLIVVLDLSSKLSEEDNIILDRTSGKNRIIVGSKSDLENILPFDTDINISSLNNDNIDKLKSIIKDKVIDMLKNTEDVSLICKRQYDEALQALNELKNIIDDKDISMDMAAYHIRKAAECLDSLQGINVGEQTLDKLFAGFCIGK